MSTTVLISHSPTPSKHLLLLPCDNRLRTSTLNFTQKTLESRKRLLPYLLYSSHWYYSDLLDSCARHSLLVTVTALVFDEFLNMSTPLSNTLAKRAVVDLAVDSRLSAANRLSHDILLVIFESLYGYLSKRLTSLQNPPVRLGFLLSMVSWTWHHAAHACKPLWQDICIFPFERDDSGPLKLLKYQVARAHGRFPLNLYVSTISPRTPPEDESSTRKRVASFMSDLGRRPWMSRLRELHISTNGTSQMRLLAPCLKGIIFQHLETLSLMSAGPGDVVLPADFLGTTNFTKLLHVDLVRVVLSGFYFTIRARTSLAVTVESETARREMGRFWAAAATAGDTLLTAHFSIENANKMISPSSYKRMDNRSISDIAINAGCARILLVSGTFQNVRSATLTQIPNLQGLMTALGWGVGPDPLFKWCNTAKGGVLFPNLRALHLDFLEARRTFAGDWKKLFELVGSVTRIKLHTQLTRGGKPSISHLAIHLNAKGVEMWPHLTELTIRDRSEVVFESMLGSLIKVYSSSTPRIDFDMDHRSHEHMARQERAKNLPERLPAIAAGFDLGFS